MVITETHKWVYCQVIHLSKVEEVGDALLIKRSVFFFSIHSKTKVICYYTKKNSKKI